MNKSVDESDKCSDDLNLDKLCLYPAHVYEYKKAQSRIGQNV